MAQDIVQNRGVRPVIIRHKFGRNVKLFLELVLANNMLLQFVTTITPNFIGGSKP